MQRCHLVFILVLSSLLGCGREQPPADGTELDRIWASQDTSTFKALIADQPFGVRFQLEALQIQYIRSKALGDSSKTLDLGRELSWLVRTYTELTDIGDEQRKLEVSEAWSRTQAEQKLHLDSLYGPASQNRNLRDRVQPLRELGGEYQSIADSFHYAAVLMVLGSTFYELGYYDSAEVYLGNCLELSSCLGDPSQTGDCQCYLAQVKGTYRGDYSRAEILRQQSKANLKSVGRDTMTVELSKLENLLQLHQNNRVIEHAHRLRAQFVENRDEAYQAYCSYCLGEAFYDMLVLDSAETYARESSNISECLSRKNAHHLSSLAYSQNLLARILQKTGRMAEAQDQYERAIATATNAGDSSSLAVNVADYAWFQVEQEALEGALVLFRKAAHLATDHESRLFTSFGLAVCYYRLGDLQSAKDLARQCISLYELGRKRVLDPTVKVGTLSDKADIYRLLASAYLREYESSADRTFLDSAHQYLDRGKSVALVELLETETDLPPTSKEEELLNELSLLQGNLLESSRPPDTLGRRITEVEDLLFSERLARTADLTGGDRADVRTVPSLAQLAGVCKPDSALLIEYLVSSYGCWAIAVTGNDEWLTRLEISDDSLKQLVDACVVEVNQRPDPESNATALAEIAGQLGELLITKVVPRLDDWSNLILIPSGPLRTLPFAALRSDDNRYLVERAALTVAPSARVLSILEGRPREPGRDLLALFTNPVLPIFDRSESHSYDDGWRNSLFARILHLGPIPYSGVEAESIAAIFDTGQVESYIGAAATKAALETLDLRRLSILHIATHGLIDDQVPERSAIWLSPVKSDNDDGLLQGNEIVQLSLNADLIFLSACETAQGKIYPGEGVLSLARPFLVGGASSVIATHWSIDDRSAVEVVSNFYRSLNNGETVCEALASAQRKMIHSERELYRHPFYWAAYAVYGCGTRNLD